MIELAITVRNDDRSMTQKHLLYDTPITVSHEDEVLKQLVEDARRLFGDSPEDILLKIKFQW